MFISGIVQQADVYDIIKEYGLNTATVYTYNKLMFMTESCLIQALPNHFLFYLLYNYLSSQIA